MNRSALSIAGRRHVGPVRERVAVPLPGSVVASRGSGFANMSVAAGGAWGNCSDLRVRPVPGAWRPAAGAVRSRGGPSQPLVDQGLRLRGAGVVAGHRGEERRPVDGRGLDRYRGHHGRRPGQRPEERDLADAVARALVAHVEAALATDTRRRLIRGRCRWARPSAISVSPAAYRRARFPAASSSSRRAAAGRTGGPSAAAPPGARDDGGVVEPVGERQGEQRDHGQHEARRDERDLHAGSPPAAIRRGHPPRRRSPPPPRAPRTPRSAPSWACRAGGA